MPYTTSEAFSSLILIAALASNFMPQTACAQTEAKSGRNTASRPGPSQLAAPRQSIAPASTANGVDSEQIASIPMVPFDQVSSRDEPTGDRLGSARRIATAVVAQDNPAPKMVADVGFDGNAWERRLKGARVVAASEGLAARSEGPPIHLKDSPMPTLDDHLAALRAAGIDDVQVVWRRLDTVVIMGRKR
jgi:hypothetical protein